MMVQIKRIEVLRAYDKKGNIQGSDASAITGIWGEELVLGLLVHYLRRAGNIDAQILKRQCKGNGRKGKRLDGWVKVDKNLLYQVEVKNWSTHSVGGKCITENYRITEPETIAYAQNEWNKWITQGLINQDPSVSKVLTPMIPPLGHDGVRILPLVGFWRTIFNPNDPRPLSSYLPPEGCSFQECHLFSASAYLRSLDDDLLSIEMPNFKRRMKAIKDMTSPNDEPYSPIQT